MVHDPASEYMVEWSPYAYAYNNPISFIDDDGEMPGPVGALVGILSEYILQVGSDYLGRGRTFQNSLIPDSNDVIDLGIAGGTGFFTGGVGSLIKTAGSGTGRKMFVKIIDEGFDIMINAIQDIAKDYNNTGDFDLTKSFTGALLEGIVSKVLPSSVVDQLEKKLMKKMKISANNVEKYRKRMNNQQNRNKTTRSRTKTKYENSVKDYNNFRNTYIGVKTVNDVFKTMGADALKDTDLYKKTEGEIKKRVGTITVGDLEEIL